MSGLVEFMQGVLICMRFAAEECVLINQRLGRNAVKFGSIDLCKTCVSGRNPPWCFAKVPSSFSKYELLYVAETLSFGIRSPKDKVRSSFG